MGIVLAFGLHCLCGCVLNLFVDWKVFASMPMIVRGCLCEIAMAGVA